MLRNNTCAEEMLKYAASHILNKELHFPSFTKDEQIDLAPAWVNLNSEEQGQIIFERACKTAEEIPQFLGQLDKSKAYFLRIGEDNGAGHWQWLHYVRDRRGWQIYSSPLNNDWITQSTSAGADEFELTAAAADRLLYPSSSYRFFCIEATEARLRAAINFVTISLTQSEVEAIEYGCAPKQVSEPLMAGIVLQDRAQAQQVPEPLATDILPRAKPQPCLMLWSNALDDRSTEMQQAIDHYNEHNKGKPLNALEQNYLLRLAKIGALAPNKEAKQEKRAALINLLKAGEETTYAQLSQAAHRNTGFTALMGFDKCIDWTTTGRQVFRP